MSKKLMILIILSAILFLIYVIKSIRHQELTVKNSLIWIVLSISIIIVALWSDFFEKMANMFGIEKLSNMFFYLGFLFFIFLCFNITKIISVQNKRIINLTQELALLKNEVDKNVSENGRNHKNK